VLDLRRCKVIEFFVGHDDHKVCLAPFIPAGEVAENQVFGTVGEVTVERVTWRRIS
jgi:hypothetical protein